MTASPTGPTGTELALRPAGELAALLRSGAIGSRDLLELYLERIEAIDPELGAVVTLDADGARAQADAADRALAEDGPTGALHGLPVTVKDSIETRGMRTTAGATALAGHVPDRDATVVARVRAAGAVVMGKTNLPEWAGDSRPATNCSARRTTPGT